MPYYIWSILCLALALFLAFLEIFIPSAGLLAFLSATALIGSVVFAFLTHPWLGIVFLVGELVMIYLLIQLFPKTPIGRRFILNPDDDPVPQPDPKIETLKQLVGKRGIAQSKMMLSGRVEIDGRCINAVSEMETVEPGEAVVVTRIDGTSVLVQKTAGVSGTAVSAADAPEQKEIVEDPFL